MKIKLYKYPEKVGWLGWIENCKEQAIGFIKTDGTICWEW